MIHNVAEKESQELNKSMNFIKIAREQIQKEPQCLELENIETSISQNNQDMIFNDSLLLSQSSSFL